jgi:hypothetical protein
MNTPRVVMTETKKAFRNIFKRDDLQAACQALCNLKGVGPAMASGNSNNTTVVSKQNGDVVGGGLDHAGGRVLRCSFLNEAHCTDH